MIRWWCLLALAGCGFQSDHADDLGVGADAMSDGANADDGAHGGAPDLAGDAGPALNCPPPLLLATVADEGPGTGMNGAVLAFHVEPGGTLHKCNPYSGGGMALYKPYHAAFIPPDAIAVADDSADTVFLLDANSDTIRWKYVYVTGALSFGGRDVFPIVHGGETLVAVARSTAGAASTVRDRLDLLRDGNMLAFLWKLDGNAQPVSNVAATCASPLDPGRFFAVQNGSAPEAAFDDDPFAVAATPYASYPNGSTLITVQAANVAGVHRTAWIDVSVGKLWYANDGGGTPSVIGPVGCPLAGCTLVDAAPDPSDANHFYAMCDYPNATPVHRDIVYLTAGGSCTTVYDSTPMVASSLALQRISVAAP